MAIEQWKCRDCGNLSEYEAGLFAFVACVCGGVKRSERDKGGAHVKLARLPAELGPAPSRTPWVSSWEFRDAKGRRVRLAVRLPDGALIDARTWIETAHTADYGDVTVVYDVEEAT